MEPDFNTDRARLDQIRRAHDSARPTSENPAWQNCHGDCGFMLGFIDRLWQEYSRTLRRADSAGDTNGDGKHG